MDSPFLEGEFEIHMNMTSWIELVNEKDHMSWLFVISDNGPRISLNKFSWDVTSFKTPKDLKHSTNCTQEKKSFSGLVFHGLWDALKAIEIQASDWLLK